MEDIRLLFFQYFPGSIVTFYAGLGLLGWRLNSKRTLVLGCVGALSIYLVRSLYSLFHLPFGSHSLILMVLFVVYMRFIGRTKWSVALAGTLLGAVISGIGEVFLIPLFLKISGFNSFTDVLANVWANILCSYISSTIPLALLSALVYCKKFSLLKSNTNSSESDLG